MKIEKKIELQRANEICPGFTRKKLTNGALLLDVRRDSEVGTVRYDVENYLHIPLHELESRLAEVPQNKEIVLACLSGSRSLKATYFLMNHGYNTVFNLEGGILKWAKKGFPLIGDVSSLLEGESCDCSQPECC